MWCTHSFPTFSESSMTEETNAFVTVCSETKSWVCIFSKDGCFQKISVGWSRVDFVGREGGGTGNVQQVNSANPSRQARNPIRRNNPFAREAWEAERVSFPVSLCLSLDRQVVGFMFRGPRGVLLRRRAIVVNRHVNGSLLFFTHMNKHKKRRTRGTGEGKNRNRFFFVVRSRFRRNKMTRWFCFGRFSSGNSPPRPPQPACPFGKKQGWRLGLGLVGWAFRSVVSSSVPMGFVLDLEDAISDRWWYVTGLFLVDHLSQERGPSHAINNFTRHRIPAAVNGYGRPQNKFNCTAEN